MMYMLVISIPLYISYNPYHFFSEKLRFSVCYVYSWSPEPTTICYMRHKKGTINSFTQVGSECLRRFIKPFTL